LLSAARMSLQLFYKNPFLYLAVFPLKCNPKSKFYNRS
jgi:hypothetical protein